MDLIILDIIVLDLIILDVIVVEFSFGIEVRFPGLKHAVNQFIRQLIRMVGGTVVRMVLSIAVRFSRESV